METTNIIDYHNQIYIGKYSQTHTLNGYINALEECMYKYAKKTFVEKWICTSTFGFGEGYNQRREIYTLDGGSNVLVYINRAFTKKDDTLRVFMRQSSKFDNIPNGGKFYLEDFINYLKTKI